MLRSGYLLYITLASLWHIISFERRKTVFSSVANLDRRYPIWHERCWALSVVYRLPEFNLRPSEYFYLPLCWDESLMVNSRECLGWGRLINHLRCIVLQAQSMVASFLKTGGAHWGPLLEEVRWHLHWVQLGMEGYFLLLCAWAYMTYLSIHDLSDNQGLVPFSQKLAVPNWNPWTPFSPVISFWNHKEG